jgi:hypothetical protein
LEWTRAIDGYCERVDPSFWAEPFNAVTNVAFLIAAWIMWRRTRGLGLPVADMLCRVLVLIGVTSFLFHTFAHVWAAAADSLSILVFVILYIWAANRHYWNAPAWGAGLLTAAYIPYSVALGWVFSRLPFLEISAEYWPLPVLIGAYAFLLRGRFPQLATGLAIGAGILCVSLVFRSLDQIVCAAFPLGTHFIWHILNAIMLGWMIEVYRRHMVATGRAAG